MLSKIIYLILLLFMFLGEYYVFGIYIKNYHKGRVIDSLIAGTIIIMGVFLICMFSGVYEKFFLK